MKILFLCRKNNTNYGRTYGLDNSAKFVSNCLDAMKGITSEIVVVNDSNDIDREVTKRNPRIVVLEALWVTPAKMKELLSLCRHSQRIWVIRIHSLWSFLSQEGMALTWLNGYRFIDFEHFYIAPNTEEMTQDLIDLLKLNSVYLPNIYCPPKYPKQKLIKKEKDEIHIGCFGAIRPLKNIFTQAIAAVKFANDLNLHLHFHVNGERIEQWGEQNIKNLTALFDGQELHYLIKHPWLSHEKFNGLVRQMDMGMQISFSETFNIVAADFVFNKVPIVVSEDISWAPDKIKAYNHNSIKKIVEKMHELWNAPYRPLVKLCLDSLKQHNTEAINHWSNFIKSVE